jgi:eukaryotic-like serine/threonine-protein kinase
VEVHKPEAWKRIEDIFLQAAEIPAAQRKSYLDTACEGDEDVRGEVEALLAADVGDETEIASFMRESVVAMVSEAFRQDGPLSVSGSTSQPAGQHDADAGMKGQRIGEWKLVEEIGRGGMGTVYRAVRGDGEFSIEAAIKVLSRGVNSQILLDRFRRERQILARLEHPNIARLLDGGKTSSGLPYLVMEYVPGMALTRYCDERQLSIRDRLALFRKVCDAVSCAHRNLVIHRDLKPDNILVTGDGVPKLLDFGIAKLLESGTGETGELTMTAERVGTPSWCSPEQIRGEHVGVATDVYSLGVVLFRLLTGYRPYRAESVTWENAIQVICEREPMQASETMSGKAKSEEESKAVAKQRSTTPEGLGKQLTGDIDNILAFALRKEPDRRYRSVDELSDELQRHLDGRPVIAAGDTVIYKVCKFVQRHQLGVGAAVVLTTLLCISTVAAIWQARRLSVRVTEDRKLAATLLFDLHDNIAHLPGSLPAREALLRQSLEYLNGLARDAGQDRETRRSLALAGERFANLLGTLGRSADSLRTWQTARVIREGLANEQPADLTLQYELGNSYLSGAVITSRAGTVDDMQQLNQKALQIAEMLVSAEPGVRQYQHLLADCWASRSNGFNILGRAEEATAALRRAVPIREKLAATARDATGQYELAMVRYHLGMIEAQAEQPGIALRDLEEALRLQKLQPPSAQLNFDMASTHHFLAVSLGSLRRYDEALDHIRQAITLREKALRDDEHDARSRSLLAGNYSQQGIVLLDKGQPEEALASMQHAIALQQELLAVDPRGVPARISMATYLSREASILAANHRIHESAEAWRRAVKFYDDLKRGGFLSAPDVVKDSETAHEEAAKLAGQ